MFRRSIVALSFLTLFVPFTEARAEHIDQSGYSDEGPVGLPYTPRKSRREEERDMQRGDNYKKWMKACNEGGGRAGWGTKDEDPDAFGGVESGGEPSKYKAVCSCVTDADQKRLDEVKPYREGVPDTGPKMEEITDSMKKIRPLAQSGDKVCPKDPATEARKERDKKISDEENRKLRAKQEQKEKKEREAKEKAEEKTAREAKEKENQEAYNRAQEKKKEEAAALKAKKDAAQAALRERWDKYHKACELGGGMAVSNDIDRPVCYCDQHGMIKFMASRSVANYCAKARAKEEAKEKATAAANRDWCAKQANADYNERDQECVCRIRTNVKFAVGKGSCGSDAYQRSMYYSLDVLEAGVIGVMDFRRRIRGDGGSWLPSLPRIPIVEPWE